MASLFANNDCISVYTRADAIRDGILVDVSAVAGEEGFKVPVALTDTAFRSMDPSLEEKCAGEDLRGRLHDMFWMLRSALRRKSYMEASRIDFKMLVNVDNKPATCNLKAVLHPGDQGEPVMTVMLPHED